jgi:hypothetical protein
MHGIFAAVTDRQVRAISAEIVDAIGVARP